MFEIVCAIFDHRLPGLQTDQTVDQADMRFDHRQEAERGRSQSARGEYQRDELQPGGDSTAAHQKADVPDRAPHDVILPPAPEPG